VRCGVVVDDMSSINQDLQGCVVVRLFLLHSRLGNVRGSYMSRTGSYKMSLIFLRCTWVVEILT